MTTRISSGGPQTNVLAVPTAARTTATPSRPFQQVISTTSRAIVQGAEQAAVRLPGGPILAAAMRPGPGTVPSGSAQSAEGVSSAVAPNGLGSTGAVSSSGSAGSGSIEGVLSQGVDQNLYFLELQERISQENRTYTTLSNVLKARHDTVKNAIGNIR